MKHRPISRLAFPIATAIMVGLAISVTPSHAAGSFADSLTAPTIDGADIAYLPAAPNANPGDKWFSEISGAGQTKGQTFTTTQDVLLNSVTYRLSGTTQAAATKVYVLRVGAIDPVTNTFYDLHSEEITQSDLWDPGAYGTFTLNTPLTLPAGAYLGVDVAMKSSTSGWQTGIPYPAYVNTSPYAGGMKYTRPQTGTTGSASPVVQNDAGRDREFHLDMTATTITDTTAPTVTSINDQVGGGPIYEDQVQVTYLLTFDEAINASTIDLADFENAFPGSGVSIDSVVSVQNTTPYPIASVVKVVLGISGTGTLNLGIKSGSDIADFAATPNLVTSPVADDTTITVNSGTTPGTGNRWWDLATTGITDGVSQGGTGNWNTTTTNWDRGFGFASPVAWDNAGGNTGIFGGTAGTVTLDNDIALDGLTVNLPSAGGSGYSIGDATEDNTLNFSGSKTITATATGTGTNQDATIKAGIAGSPTLNIAGRATNSVNSFSLLPTANVTMTLGPLNMLNTFGSNKRLILGGESTGNVVDDVTWNSGSNQLMLTKAGTGSWTINQDVVGNTSASRLYVEQGTLTLSGTNNYFSHKVGVATNRESTFTASNQTSKLVAKDTMTIGDNREYFYVQNAGTLSPGPGVETLTVRWNANSNTTTTHAQFNMQTGSTYEWDIASSTSTDVIDVQTGGSNFANLILGNITLKITDAGANTAITPTDQLTVFTYETAQPVARSIGTVNFDTSALGAGWTVGTLALTDDGNGTIYLTGLSFTSGPATPFETWGNGTFANGTLTDKTAGGDDDADLLTNLREYAFGTDPTVNFTGLIEYVNGGAVTTPGQPVLLPEGGTYYAVFGRRVDHVAAGLTYTVEFSADLSSPWVASAVEPTTLATDGVIDAVSVPFPGLINTDSGPLKARFFRVAVSLAP